MKNVYLLCLVYLLTLSSNLSARPTECRTDRGARAYKAGYDMQKDLLNDLWKEYSGCDKFSDFVGNVAVDFKKVRVSSPALSCRNYGAERALENTLLDLSLECKDEGVASGASVGKIAGELFCVTKRLPDIWLKLKSSEAEVQCKAAVLEVLTAKCDESLEDSKLVDELIAQSCGG